MSSIDKISINRYEPDNSLAQEHKRQLARQHQLASRETKHLVLPSIETQSRLAAKRTLDNRRQSAESASRGFAAGLDTGSAVDLEEDLLGLAIDMASASAIASGEVTADRLAPRFISQRPAPGSPDANAEPKGKDEVATEAASLASARQQEEAFATEKTAGRSAAASDETAAVLKEHASSRSLWLQKLETAFSAEKNASSVAATQVVEELLEQMMHEVQTRAAQSEALPSDLKAALDALASKRMTFLVTNPDAEDASGLQGSFRFLDAFLESMAKSTAAESDIATVDCKTIDKPQISDVSKIVPEPGKTADDALDRMNENDFVSPARDRQTLYEFLELLSNIAGSSTASALQQLAEARRTNPEKALLRLAASGDHAVALYSPEIFRRFEMISARMERDGKKSARVSMLAEAVAIERQWMQSVIDEAESIVGYGALSRRSEREMREKNLTETLPQLILQKT